MKFKMKGKDHMEKLSVHKKALKCILQKLRLALMAGKKWSRENFL
jgi:hypothetical protein